ncbi:4-deoxy-L-threo-5-hexulose uronate isomerase [Cnuella takakiae]|uniref:4-deoxy-L-threo-5-hexosulose-uronate ketol-isomerase n=1 Tax=Cnuella takakiae TaxID=1302690 RepID=A0A1M5A3Y6_9BACT|nr:5-dehydro-4-deoxy-D-glucuronate isomerase [Cnuella takakiae]OLY92111.1 5-dehydro-4-deoxy-D-glucuronate isomerase [Cnuella takakiae]SHF24807.1 4-deoxy-L-threo-5-hexulose uronate isomerase [Cnuella takakiae]
MTEIFACSPREVKGMDTAALRESFLLEDLFAPAQIQFTYTHYDRMIVGSALPTDAPLTLGNYDPLKAQYFLERRELGIINIGGKGTVTADGQTYELSKLDCLYLGKGTKDVQFASADAANPAAYYLLSAPAHAAYPNTLMTAAGAAPVQLGTVATSNQRTIYKYIHEDGIASCQLVMGLTVLEPGSVWNTMPAHTHNRRMEAYLYFDLAADSRVFHLMGQPSETRHLVVADRQAIVCPPWSIHSGCGTAAYSFIWGMAGENKAFTDMDPVTFEQLR